MKLAAADGARRRGRRRPRRGPRRSRASFDPRVAPGGRRRPWRPRPAPRASPVADRRSAASVGACSPSTPSRIDPDDPLSGLGGRRAPRARGRPTGWTTVDGQGRARSTTTTCGRCAASGSRADALPMILGCDAAGVDEDGNEVVVHAVIGDPAAGGGDETLDPRRSLLSERLPGHARRAGRRAARATSCPSRPRCRFEEAACLPTAWLTAYRMLFIRGGAQARRHACSCRAPAAASRPPRSCWPARPGSGSGRPAATRRKRARALELGAARGVRARRPAARAGRRRHRDRRRGDLEPLAQVAATRRPHRRLAARRPAPNPPRRADPGLLPPAVGHRLDDGHPRRARRAGRLCARDGHRGRSSTRRTPCADARVGVRAARLAATSSASRPSPSDRSVRSTVCPRPLRCPHDVDGSVTSTSRVAQHVR